MRLTGAGKAKLTLRVVGNVSSAIVTEGIIPAATATNDFVEKNELGLKARALLELGIEQAIYAFDPERRERERAEEEARLAAEKAAAERAARKAYKDSLPFWDLEKYSPE